MDDIDFSKIILTQSEKKFFKKFQNKPLVKADYFEAQPLASYFLIEQNYIGLNDIGSPIFDENYKITNTGKRYFEYLRLKKIEEIPERITTVIAILAFGMSLYNFFT